MNPGVQKKYNLVVSVTIFLFILQIFSIAEYLRSIMVLNLGWGNIYPLRLYTVGPLLILITYKYCKEKQFAMPYFKLFLLVFLGFIFMESLPFRQGRFSYSFLDMLPFVGKLLDRPEPAYSFAKEQLYIYIYFLLLINFGLSRKCFYKVINYSLIAGILICVITYLGYLGIIEIGTDFRLADALHQKLPSTMFNANNTSHICVFSILFLIIKQRSEKKFSRYYVLRDLLIILFLVSMAVINATRGAVINLFILIPYYFFMVWKESKDTVAKSALIAVMFLTAAIVAFNASKITLATRIKIYHSIMPDRPVRIDNLMNTWDNFRTHPFVGVGFENAAKTDLRHGSRSNNQFMQLLASCGVFYFLIYICYFSKLFVGKISLLKRPEVLLSLLLVISHSMLRRPMDMIPIFAYITAYFGLCPPRNTSAKKPPSLE